jgi:tetratricopeptide (TPR) repeat protein
MGDIYSQLGDNTNASSSFASALATYRQIYGTKHQTVADVLQRMSAHFVKVGEFERGYSCVKEALTLWKELLGPEDTKTGDSQFIMGTILFEWNDFAEASKFFEKARSIHKQKLGETDLNVANSNFYLGCISGKYYLLLPYPDISCVKLCSNVTYFLPTFCLQNGKGITNRQCSVSKTRCRGGESISMNLTMI